MDWTGDHPRACGEHTVEVEPSLDAYAAQLTRAVDAACFSRRLTRSLAN